MILQVNIPYDCFNNKTINLTSQHDDEAQCMYSYNSVICMVSIGAGQENSFGLHVSDSNCPVSLRRWFVAADEVEEEEQETSLQEILSEKKMRHSCSRPYNKRTGQDLLVGTTCPGKYVAGFIIMNIQTWYAADIVE